MVKPGKPNWQVLRANFLGEHTHDANEVRHFAEGGGAFHLHIGERIYRLTAEAGDLLSVPRGVSHGFDGGLEANFTSIRVFTHTAGWIAHFTGSSVSKTFPAYEQAA